MQATGTCGWVEHGAQPGARRHVLRRPLPADLIQCSKVESNLRIFQATSAQCDIARTGSRRGTEETELGSQSETLTTKSVA